MLLQVILEGLGLGILLVLVCAVGIRKGAVGMVHLYSPAVQQRCVKLGLTTHEKIKRNSLLFKAVCVPGYISYVLVCVYGINGARSFAAGFWQLLVILSVMNLIDRFLIDGYWVEWKPEIAPQATVIYRLCAGLCLWDKRCKGLCSGFLAVTRYLVRYESHGPPVG